MIRSVPVQFRKKADPARDLVRQWVRDWRDDPRVSREESYRQVTGKAHRQQGDQACMVKLPATLACEPCTELPSGSGISQLESSWLHQTWAASWQACVWCHTCHQTMHCATPCMADYDSEVASSLPCACMSMCC